MRAQLVPWNGGLIKIINDSPRDHIKKMRCVPNLVPWLHQFNLLTQGGSNYAHNRFIIYERSD